MMFWWIPHAGQRVVYLLLYCFFEFHCLLCVHVQGRSLSISLSFGRGRVLQRKHNADSLLVPLCNSDPAHRYEPRNRIARIVGVLQRLYTTAPEVHGVYPWTTLSCEKLLKVRCLR